MVMCTSKMFGGRQSAEGPSLSVEERADRHVRRLQGFYAHLAVYVGVNAMLVVINLLTSPGVFWAIWPILGWGVKLGAHAVAVFGLPGVADWKVRARRAYIRRHKDRPSSRLNRNDEGAPESEAERLRRRIEHLEAIVTSADWDLLSDLDDDAPADERVAALADDVVSH
jgi:hypothetical protein